VAVVDTLCKGRTCQPQGETDETASCLDADENASDHPAVLSLRPDCSYLFSHHSSPSLLSPFLSSSSYPSSPRPDFRSSSSTTNDLHYAPDRAQRLT
jgi:hypothetical protein